VHTLFTHVDIPPQTLPQAPQLFRSVVRLTHPPLQTVGVPPAHVGEQAPFEQKSCVAPGGSAIAAQSFPQRPQFALLASGFTHTPLQRICPAGQTQAPATHVSPPVQTSPQRPQLAVSIASLTHALLQFVSGAMHVRTHAPLAQTGVLAVHALPHRPQLAGSELRFEHAPLHAVSGEHVSPSTPVSRAAGESITTTSRVAMASAGESTVASGGDASGSGTTTPPSKSTSRSVRPHPAGAMAARMQSVNAAKRKK
jgi:hypothetical protein